MDYEKILDAGTKRHILLSRIEDYNNRIRYIVEEYQEENDIENAVKLLEDYYQVVSEFFERRIDNKTDRD